MHWDWYRMQCERHEFVSLQTADSRSTCDLLGFCLLSPLIALCFWLVRNGAGAREREREKSMQDVKGEKIAYEYEQ